MYMKNAIIATNVGSTSRFVSESNGYLIDNYEVDQVYEMLKVATSNRRLLGEMGDKSSKKVLKDFSTEIYLKELKKIYNSLSVEKEN